jgi:hypothetical protein
VSGQIWIYVPIGSGGEPGVDLPEPSARFPMLQTYIRTVAPMIFSEDHRAPDALELSRLVVTLGIR